MGLFKTILGGAFNILGGPISVMAYGQYKAGQAQKRAYYQNAEDQLAADRETIASSRAQVGASAVTMEGSPLQVMAESARIAELNAMRIRRQGDLAAKAAKIRAGQTFIGGALDVFTGDATGGVARVGSLLSRMPRRSGSPTILSDPVSTGIA